jgi:hypothetical protein
MREDISELSHSQRETLGSSLFCVDDRFNLSRPMRTRHPE